MNKKTTPLKNNISETAQQTVKAPSVSEKTLALLRSFAANYYVESSLPNGLAEIMLS